MLYNKFTEAKGVPHMAIMTGSKAQLTLRFWKASLAWKNIGKWAQGWTTESFIDELRHLCNDNGVLGSRADTLLDDMIFDRERREQATPGTLYHFPVRFASQTQDLGQQTLTA